MVVKLQEEVEQKTFNIVVSTTKLTARTILNAGRTAIQQYQAKMAGGKQSVRMLLRQNRGVSSVEIDKTNIKGFERYAKKYGIDYAIRKDSSEVPPRYLVFFKAPDVEAFNAAFKEYSVYPDYRKARDEMQELMKAQKNVEMFFAEEKDTAEKEPTR